MKFKIEDPTADPSLVIDLQTVADGVSSVLDSSGIDFPDFRVLLTPQTVTESDTLVIPETGRFYARFAYNLSRYFVRSFFDQQPLFGVASEAIGLEVLDALAKSWQDHPHPPWRAYSDSFLRYRRDLLREADVHLRENGITKSERQGFIAGLPTPAPHQPKLEVLAGLAIQGQLLPGRSLLSLDFEEQEKFIRAVLDQTIEQNLVTLPRLLALNELKLVHWRLFRSFSLSFEPDVTILLGKNGAGKTSIVDALRTTLSLLVTSRAAEQTPLLDNGDVYREPGGTQSQPAMIESLLEIDGLPVRSSWRFDGTTLDSDAFDEARRISSDFQNLTTDGSALPLVAVFQSTRTPITPITTAPVVRSGRSGYATDWLDAGNDLRWLTVSLEDHQAAQPDNLDVDAPMVAAINKALGALTFGDTTWTLSVSPRSGLRFKRTTSATAEVFRFKQLSDGERMVLSLFIDLASRCWIANPHLGAEACGQTGGIVLIDELDSHLHLAWQYQIVRDLRSAFPVIQFIISTHSAELVTSVSERCIRLLGHGEVVEPQPDYSEGALPSEVSKKIMKVPERDPKSGVRQKLESYRSALNAGTEMDCEQLFRDLQTHPGYKDPEFAVVNGLRLAAAARRKRNASS
jgi:predicted ATP-binding protein involved in virulence